jgi:hypothetical protein
MGEKPPTRGEWGDLKVDPEVKYAYRLFGGRTLAEAKALFVENPIERAAELHYAAAPVLNYYLFCFVEHLLSPESAGESDMASCFLRLVRHRMASRPEDLDPAWDRLRPAIATIAQRQAFYDADTNIYGSFLDLWREIETARERRGSGGA